MNNHNQAYCQFKYAQNFNLDENPSLLKPREECAIQRYTNKFYLEEYHDFQTLIERIDSIYNRIVKGYKNQNISIFSDKCAFPEFFISNKYGENDYPIGVSSYGWKISILHSC